MEMSVGTIVTIVLLVTVLVLGLVLVRNIFDTGSDAVDQIDAALQNEINELFAEDEGRLIIFPASREITLDRGDTPKGFAFSVRNSESLASDATFDYDVYADDVSNCQDTISQGQATELLLAREGEFYLGRGQTLEIPRLVRFDIPEDAPLCTIVYNIEINRNNAPYSSAQIFVTIE